MPTPKLFINTNIYMYNRIKHSTPIYCLAGMFGRVNVWRIAELKVIGKIRFGEWIDFGHKDAIYMLKFDWFKFGESWMTRQIHQTFPLPLYGRYHLYRTYFAN